MDRSPKNGFRCALYPDPGKIPAAAFQPVEVAIGEVARTGRLQGRSRPGPRLPGLQGAIFVRQDRSEVPCRIEEGEPRRLDPGKGQLRCRLRRRASQRLSFSSEECRAPLSDGRLLPRGGLEWQRSSEDIENYYEFPMFLSFIVKNGRAVLYPIYKGTFERGTNDMAAVIDFDTGSRQYAELLDSGSQGLQKIPRLPGNTPGHRRRPYRLLRDELGRSSDRSSPPSRNASRPRSCWPEGSSAPPSGSDPVTYAAA